MLPENNELQRLTVDRINNLLRIYKSNNKSTLLVLAGGSNLDNYNFINTSLIDSNTSVCVLDERFTTDTSKSNYAQILSKCGKFYNGSILNGAVFFDTSVKNGDNENILASRFNQQLNEWFQKNPDGNVLVTIGIGSDGHISGMKPLDKEEFHKLFESQNDNDLVVGYDASKVDPENPIRVTTTLNFFRKIKEVANFIVYAVNKSEVVAKVKSNSGNLNETPALILNEMKNVEYFNN